MKLTDAVKQFGKVSKNVGKGTAAGCLIAALFLCCPTAAQDRKASPDDETPAPAVKNGFHVYQAGASIGYASIPGGILGSGTDFRQLGCDCNAVASVSAGYAHAGPVNHVDVIYSPSYSGIYGAGGLQSFDENLQISWEARWGPKWRFTLDAQGDDSSLVQLALQPFSGLVSSSATPTGDLSSGSVLPPNSLLYGGRVLSLGSRAGLTYQPSTRLHLLFEGGVYQIQSRDSGSTQTNQSAYVIPRARFETGTANLSYALTTRTEVGVRFSGTMYHTALGDYRTIGATGSYGRKLTRRWWAFAEAGVGNYTSGARANELTRAASGGSQFVGNAGVSYQGRENSVAVSYSRMVGDLYGLASSSMQGVEGTWKWRQPGRNWLAYASVAYQRLSGGPLGDGTNWQATAGVGRSLSRRTSMTLSYGYLKTTVGGLTSPVNDSVQVARLTLLWSAFQVPAAVGGALGTFGAPY